MHLCGREMGKVNKLELINHWDSSLAIAIVSKEERGVTGAEETEVAHLDLLNPGKEAEH